MKISKMSSGLPIICMPVSVQPLEQLFGISFTHLTVKQQHFASPQCAALAKVLDALNSCSTPQLLDSVKPTQELISWVKEALVHSIPELRQLQSTGQLPAEHDLSPDTCARSNLKAACAVQAEGRSLHHLVMTDVAQQCLSAAICPHALPESS
jgi:hypothetical protein